LDLKMKVFYDDKGGETLEPLVVEVVDTPRMEVFKVR